MATHRVFVENRSEVPIVCRQCGRVENIQASSITRSGIPIKALCNCGFRFEVLFELRRSYRKPTNLFGVFAPFGSYTPMGYVTVTDVSKTGISFILDSDLPRGNEIKKGDVLGIQFRLNDNNGSLIKTKIVIRNTRKNQLGAEFIGLDQHTSKLIGFYLVP